MNSRLLMVLVSVSHVAFGNNLITATLAVVKELGDYKSVTVISDKALDDWTLKSLQGTPLFLSTNHSSTTKNLNIIFISSFIFLR